uniref:beta strand repeat-containing protein n=1 Tax=Methanobrevibacter sp. TaxID=66852 RepID=UPI00388E9B8F
MKSKYIFSLFLIMFCLVSLASVSASEDFNQTIGDNVDMISDVSGGTLGVSLDDVSNDTLSVSNDEQILAAGNSWYVNASNTGADRDGSQSNPFNNLNETFNSPNLNDGDTIYIAGGTYTGENNTNLVINKKLNLVNWGNDEVIFDAQYLSNIFTINVNEFNVTGITFKNGNNTNPGSFGGGALYFSYGLINSHIDATFINNTVTVNEFNACIGGGAICFMGNVDNCTFNSKFEDNSMVSTIAHSEFDAVGGGAICFIGNVTNSIFNSEFINNTFLSDKYSFCNGGGAIFFARKDTKVKNVTFNGKFINNSVNAPNAWGGAIDLLSEVIDSNFNAEFTGNYINGDDGAGGAIAILSNIINTNIGGIFKNNTIISTTNYYLYGGGAIYFYPSLYKSNITGVFIGNNASFGGSLYFRSASDVNKINATFINNTAYDGGAVYYVDTFTNTNISGRFINNNAANDGGAIFIKEVSFFVSIVDSVNIDVEFINNSAVRYGGAICIAKSIENSNISGTFKNNTASMGGAIYLINSRNNKYRGNFENNTANGENSNGGAIHISESVSDDIDGDYVANHISGSGDSISGGAIYILNLENTNISGSFINNYGPVDLSQDGAISMGGAIYIGNANNLICAADFVGNVAYQGGALMIYPKNTDAININLMSNFTDNKANEGGAVCVIGTIENAEISGKFENNSADSDGGAIYIRADLINANIGGEFNNNSANKGFGGAIEIYSRGENINVTANFNDNFAANYGGAIFIGESINNKIISNFTNNYVKGNEGCGGAIGVWEMDGTVINSNFTNNSAVKYGGAIFGWPDYYFSNNNISGNFINNSAKNFGGAICVMGDVDCSNNKINANFIGNKAPNGAAIVLDVNSVNNEINSNFIGNSIGNSANNGAIISIYDNSQDDSIFNSLFVNNTANSIIYVENGNTKIYDNIFLNNEKDYDIVSSIVNNDMLNVTNNWFGHNATNYEDGPSIDGPMVCDVWLFLNATANPESITYLETSEIAFNLFVYNNKTGSTDEKYDDTRLEPVNLTITSTNGDVDKKTAKFGDILKFTPTLCGTGSVTASVEDAYDTIELEITKVDPGLSVVVDPYEIDYGDNATINLSYNENATGTVNITLIGEKQNYTFTDIPLNETITISDTIMPGEYKVSVSYSGDDNFNNVTKNSEDNLIVNDIEILVDSLTKYYHGKEALNVSVVNSKGNPSPNKTVEITINGVTYNKTTDENGNAVLNINLNPGEYPVTVAFKDKSANATVTVLSTINGTDITKVYGDGTTYDVTVLDSEGNYLPEGSIVTFNVNGKISNSTVYGDK